MENQPPASGYGSLVSNSATSIFSSEAIFPRDDRSRATTAFLTDQQQAAINELKDFGEERILAWLTLVRSIKHDIQYHSVPGGLSSQQVNAISTLRDCSDSNIIIWLKYIALSGNVNLHNGVSRSMSKSSIAPSSRHIQRPSISTIRSSTSSLHPSFYSTSTSYSTPRSSVDYATSLPDLPEALPEQESFGHTHWCPECDKNVNTCDGWKRHMKEHESFYPCMPSGPVENMGTGDGPRCAFCGIEYPTDDHLAGHNVAICIGSSKTPSKRSRKSLMVSHLAYHGILNQAASDLADKWQRTRKKRAFSCGFCVKAFSTITEQLNHIDNEHYKHGQRKSSWDISTVIRGLLHQPKVYRFWKHLLDSNPRLVESHFHWGSPAAEILKTDLETGDTSGADLALSAFNSSVYDNANSHEKILPAVTIPVLQHMSFDPITMAGSYQAITDKTAPTNPIHSASPNLKQRNALLSRYHPSNLSADGAEAPCTDSGYFQASNCGAYSLIPNEPCHSDNLSSGMSESTFFDGVSILPEMWASLDMLPEATSDTHSRSPFSAHPQSHEPSGENVDLLYSDYVSPEYLANPDSLSHRSRPRMKDLGHNRVNSSPSLPPTDHGCADPRGNFKSWEKPLPAIPDSGGKSKKARYNSRPQSPNDMEMG